MFTRSQIGGVIAPIVLSLVGCTAEIGDPSEEPIDGIETTQQEIWKATWTGRSNEEVVGISRTLGGRPYAWYATGWVCRGNESAYGGPPAENLCANSSYKFYVPPGYSPKDIRGVAIKKNNNRVITWYRDSTFTSGTSDQLDAYSTNTAFHPPTKPGGGTFSMNQLLDADHGVDEKYYYYWINDCNTALNPGCNPLATPVVYRTIGSAADADEFGSATPVTMPTPFNAHGSVVGTSMHALFAGIYFNSYWLTYYSDGFVNVSTSSTNLAQN
jgi:hypothetical protein